MEWFSNWFNSPYYHLLYKNRDFSEAEQFIDALTQKFAFKNTDTFLDLACGKGRHAIYLNRKGYKVTGLDIAPESIAAANLSANANLQFAVHDMRKPLDAFGKFDYILNLFTSFGYFENDEDNYKTIEAIKNGLTPAGSLILDFMNTHKIVRDLVKSETKTVEHITFNITRNIENDFIIKRISFTDNGHSYHFEERVNALSIAQFENYFKASGLKVKNIFGNYGLEPFDINNSPRMIFEVGQ